MSEVEITCSQIVNFAIEYFAKRENFAESFKPVRKDKY